MMCFFLRLECRKGAYVCCRANTKAPACLPCKTWLWCWHPLLPKKGMASGVVLSRNNQTQQNLFKFGFLSPVWALSALLRVWDALGCNRPVWALPVLLLVLGCTGMLYLTRNTPCVLTKGVSWAHTLHAVLNIPQKNGRTHFFGSSRTSGIRMTKSSWRNGA